MNNNKEYALCVKRLVSVFLILTTVVAYVQVFTVKSYAVETTSLALNVTKTEIKEDKQQIEEKQTEEKKQEEVEIAKNYERNVKVTTREIAERNERVGYKSIYEIEISKNMDLTKTCGVSKEDFKKLMKNLKCDTSNFFYNNSDLIYDLCQKYELNEIFFCGLIAGESGWDIAQNHRRTNNYISMMSKGKLIKYSSTEKGLEAAAKLLHNKYLSEDGSFYCGKTLSSVQKYFCPEAGWVNLIYTCMSKIV